ncbi:hypothetical protein ACVWY2_006090 [Bradyrhizobium sp. JR6.1]
MQTATTMPGRYYPAIFVLASATLAYQILITRFFSVMVHYHFAFGAIALAMFGLTRGAMKVYEDSTRYAPERVAPEFACHAARFALSGVAVMCAFLYAPLVVPDAYAMSALAVVALAFTIPFAEGGICITILLTRLPYVGGWLYAADLVGAAVGCLGIIFVLLVIDPVSATLWIGACAAAVGWFVVRHGEGRSDVRLSRNAALGLAALAAVHTALAATGSSHLGVIWAKGAPQTGTLFERWNTYSRIRVTDLGLTIPFGWSFSRTPDTRIEQLYLDIDADAATPITRFSGDLTKVSYLKDDVINAPYLVQQRPGDVAVVGVGGGRDILSGLYFGAQRIHGIEINPAIFEVLTDKFADYSGHLHRQPGVSLVNAEARSYINHSPDRYDLIQISLIDTWAATAAGRADADREQALHCGGVGRFLPRIEAGRHALGVALVRTDGLSRRVLSPDCDRGRGAAASGRADDRTVAACDCGECRQRCHGHDPARGVHGGAMAGRARPAGSTGIQAAARAGYRV